LAGRRLSLPRTRRLLNRQQFDTTMKEGRRIRDEYFTVYARRNDLGHGRLGMTVARRVSTAAVARNRIRRQIRESFRLHQHELPGLDIVVMANSRAAQGGNPALRGSLDAHWRRLGS
jgi:ribonuclease P protein component